MSNQPVPFYLLARLQRAEDSVVHVEVYPVRMKDHEIQYYESFDDQPDLRGLRSSACVDAHGFFGLYEFHYNKTFYRVYAGQAALIAKTLAAYNKKLAAYSAKNGPAESVGQGVQWVVQALGAAGIVLEDDEQPLIFVNGYLASEINRRVALLKEGTS